MRCVHIYFHTGHTSFRPHSSYRDTAQWPCRSKWTLTHTCSSHMGSSGRFLLVDSSSPGSSTFHPSCCIWCQTLACRNNYRGHRRGNHTSRPDRVEWTPPHSTSLPGADHTDRCSLRVRLACRLGRDRWRHSDRGCSSCKCPYILGQGFL